ncbi:MAG: chemotaxis-specific protein-glutamate methyltransferase CheB [Candidatus Latescibacterota bacterium]
MRIAIVNDLQLAVEVLRRVIRSDPDYEIAWIALDGREAVDKCARDLPDLILMDLIMPVMDGIQATCAIMRETPCPILVVTATVAGNAARVFEAMGCGALDAACTPVFGANGVIEGGEELLRKIGMVRKLTGAGIANHRIHPEPAAAERGMHLLIAIGCSTGGPRALAAILSRLPENLEAAIVVVQHVDARFAEGLAEWLREQCRLPVMVAKEGAAPEPGAVYLAETNDHLVLGEDRVFHYTPEPVNNPYRPSVDTLLFSLERNWPEKGVGALLTGIGRDGARGLLELRRAGWFTIAQDEHTSVIYGMPKAAAELGAASVILPLEEIAAAIEKRAGKRGWDAG